MKLYTIKNKYIYVFPLICFVFGGLLLILQLAPQSKNMTAFANNIVKECKNSKHILLCYDEKIEQFMNAPTNFSMKQVFELTKVVQTKNPSYMNCHVLAHKISEKETKKNPDNWKDIIAACPTTMCNNGCSHGVLMQKYKAESLSDAQIEAIKPDLATVCMPRDNWHPETVEISMCHHGLGHLAMYATKANILKSIEICSDIGKKPTGQDFTQTCTEGVFMQIFRPLEPEDFALVKNIAPTKTTVNAFCANYQGLAYHACHRESSAYFSKEILTPQGLTTFCGYTSDSIEQEKCYSAMMNAVTNQYALSENNLPKLGEFCEKLPNEFTGICFAQAARRLLQIDPKLLSKALSMCQLATKSSSEDEERCYNTLVHYGSWIFTPHTNTYVTYCKSLPVKWQKKCLTLQ